MDLTIFFTFDMILTAASVGANAAATTAAATFDFAFGLVVSCPGVVGGPQVRSRAPQRL
jgi:hypothetical protein